MRPKAPSVVDVRTPAERALAESQAEYFSGLMAKPEFGYQEQTAAYDPLYERAQQQLSRRTSQAAVERGFRGLGYGPGVSAIARGTQEIQENRAAREAANREAYKQWVISGGRQATIPVGREVQPGAPSPFSQILGPVLGGIGTGLGGPLGGGLAGGFASMLGGGGGFGGGFQEGVRRSYPGAK